MSAMSGRAKLLDQVGWNFKFVEGTEKNIEDLFTMVKLNIKNIDKKKQLLYTQFLNTIIHIKNIRYVNFHIMPL